MGSTFLGEVDRLGVYEAYQVVFLYPFSGTSGSDTILQTNIFRRNCLWDLKQTFRLHRNARWQW